MEEFKIYKKTEEYVTVLYEQAQTDHLSFHNLDHARAVVTHTNEIAAHYQLSEDQMMILYVAAWFHDTGYLYGPSTGHEERSVEVFQKFAEENEIESGAVRQIEGCIMATKYPRQPKNLLEQIICDADTYHFGTKDFKKTNEAVFEEFQNVMGEAMLERTHFLNDAYIMMDDHVFYTQYAIDNLQARKKKNMKKLKKKNKEKTEEPTKSEGSQETIDITSPIFSEKQGTTKGMQTMLRLTSQNHIQLSEMADNKANILISVNAIIISVILSVLLRKLQTDPYLTIPTIIFLAFSVATIVVAILATRPKTNLGTFEDEEVIKKQTNLLFFGNFHRMSWTDYENAMRLMMKDSDYLYSSIVQDIYHLGVVLGKKYKLIRLAYNIFMVGIVVSVIIFVVFSMIQEGVSVDPNTTTVTNSSGSPF